MIKKVKIISNISYQEFPITEDMIEIEDSILKEIGKTIQFDDNGNIIPFQDNSKRIIELKLWFDTEYTNQEQKYRRLRTLNKSCDDGSNPESKLLELYNLAEQKRLEIQQLEEVNDDKGTDY